MNKKQAVIEDYKSWNDIQDEIREALGEKPAPWKRLRKPSHDSRVGNAIMDRKAAELEAWQEMPRLRNISKVALEHGFLWCEEIRVNQISWALGNDMNDFDGHKMDDPYSYVADLLNEGVAIW